VSTTELSDETGIPYPRRQRAHAPTGTYLGMQRNSAEHADAIQRRLSRLFDVSPKVITRLDGDRTVSFFVPGEPDPFGNDWCYTDSASLSASAHPLLTPETSQDPSGRGLREFVRKLRNDSTELERHAPPISYLHHNAIRDTIVATNDLLGVGRLYHANSASGSVLSNSVLAAAIALKDDALQDDEYWQAYYVTGGGLSSASPIRGVSLAPPGSVASISARGLVLRQHHSVERLLRETKEQPWNAGCPLSAARQLVQLARPYLRASTQLGLSGGVDSRFVAALAIDSGLDFRAHTYIPPTLEGEIAKQLRERSSVAYPWKTVVVNPGTVRQDSGRPQPPETPADPILARADAWYSYFGGDHWSSLIKSNAPRRRTVPAPIALSGSHGDLSRAHYYTTRDLEAGEPALPLKRFMNSFVQYRTILPSELRIKGAQLLNNAMLEFMVGGMTGYYALDYAYLYHRVRRQFPPVVPSVLLPMLTPEMILATFWRPPSEKATAAVVRRLTAQMVPSWGEVPYYHEAAAGTDPALTNKVSVQKTYWEDDAADFWSSIEAALDETSFSGITVDHVRREISSLGEGRNRTNQTFEFIFWHSAAIRALKRVNRIRWLHPANV